MYCAASNVLIENSIVAGNLLFREGVQSGPDVYCTNLCIARGVNVFTDLEGSGLGEGTSVVVVADGSLRLAPLGDYGGPTHTMPPLFGSPAIDAAMGSTRTKDQRGFEITDGAPDIGAVEYFPGAPTHLNWSPPSTLAFGIPLSNNELNAVGSVPGTVVYDPPVGTVLGLGTHILVATFYPDNPVFYDSTTSMVEVVVLAGMHAVVQAQRSMDGSILTLVWESEPNAIYTIERSESLTGWQDALSDIASQGAETSAVLPLSGTPALLRVRKQ